MQGFVHQCHSFFFLSHSYTSRVIAMGFVVVFGRSTKEVNMLTVDAAIELFKDLTTRQSNFHSDSSSFQVRQ